MPRTPQQYASIREEKRKLILATALDLFAVKGYKSTSIEQIARQAGISKGLMYNYFAGKEDLLRTIFRNVLTEMAEHFDPHHDGILEPHELRNYVEATFEQVKKNVPFWRIYTSVAFQPEVSQLLLNEYSSMGKSMETMLLDYFSRQGYRKPETEMLVLASMMSGAIIKYLGAPEYFPIDEVKNRIIEQYVKPKK